MKKHLLALSALLGLAACNVKLSSTEAKPNASPKPAPSCTRAMVTEVPPAFRDIGTSTGAVRAANCETLVVGENRLGDAVIARFDAQGTLIETSKPLAGRYDNLQVRVKRLAVINDAFYAFGLYGQNNRSLFVFRFLDTGFLDLGFGPRRDGVAKADVDPRYNVVAIGFPSIEGELIRLRNRVEDLGAGVEIDREQLVPLSGSQAMGKDLQPVPVSCELINHQAVRQQTTYQLAQQVCGELSFRASGPLGNDQLVVPMNGATNFTGALGEIRWYYEGSAPVLVSRDGLGFVKKEYVNFVQGQPSLCGTNVDSRRRYLVFSVKPPQMPDWLTNCWFM